MRKILLYLPIIGLGMTGCEDSPVSSYSEFSPPKMPVLLNAYGKLVDLIYESDYMVLKILSVIINWELDSTYLEAETDRADIDVNIDSNYVFYFADQDDDGRWGHVTISEDLVQYKQYGKIYHERDLERDQLTRTEPSGTLSQIIPTPIKAGESTELQILLINRQDNEIPFRLRNAKIVNEEASQWYGYWWQLPPYEELLENAIIEECSVSFDSSEAVIGIGSTKTLTYTVSCPEEVDITRKYEKCDNYREGRNCRTITADRNNLMLWGEIEFVDELGNKHIFPEKGVLRQFLTIE